MKKIIVCLLVIVFALVYAPAFSADIELAGKSTIESILKAGKIRVGFESGYLPFEMTNTKKYIPKATYKSFEVESEGAMEVIQGNADAFVYDLPFIWCFQAAHGEGKTFALEEPFTFEPLAIGLKKGDPDFLNFLNNFIRQYKNDGRWQKSYDKWIKSIDWQKDLA